jgi:hypothetical protein
MAITLAPNLPTAVVGGAAFTAGQGMAARYAEQLALEQMQRDRQFAMQQASLAEQQRQFNLRDELQRSQMSQQAQQFQQQFGLQSDQQQFAQQMGLAQFRQGAQQDNTRNALAAAQMRQQAAQQAASMAQQGFQFNTSMADRERQRQFGLMGEQLGQQNAMQRMAFDFQNRAALTGAQLQAQQQFAADQNDVNFQQNVALQGMQDQAQDARSRQSYSHQLDIMRQQATARQMNSDWQAIQESWGGLDEDQRNEVVGQFQERYSSAGLPMPIRVPEPETPPELDPLWQLNQFQEQYPGVPFRVNREGDIEVPRGFNPQMTPQYWEREQEREQRQHQFKMEEAAAQQQQADYESRLSNSQKYASAMATARKNAQAMFTRESNDGIKTTKVYDAEAAQPYIQAEMVRARGAYVPSPPGRPPIPPEYQGIPYILSPREVEYLNDGELHLVLVNGQWEVAVKEPYDAESNSGGGPAATTPQPTQSPANGGGGYPMGLLGIYNR